MPRQYGGLKERTLKELKAAVETRVEDGRAPDWVTEKGDDLDNDGKVEDDEKEIADAKSKVSDVNQERLDLTLSPDNPELRDAHGKYLSASENLVVAVADYKDARRDDKPTLRSGKGDVVTAGVSSGSDRRPTPQAQRGTRTGEVLAVSRETGRADRANRPRQGETWRTGHLLRSAVSVAGGRHREEVPREDHLQAVFGSNGNQGLTIRHPLC